MRCDDNAPHPSRGMASRTVKAKKTHRLSIIRPADDSLAAAPKMTRLPISNHKQRHHGKQPEQHVINCSRHTISGCEILSYRQAANPEHKREFPGEQEAERDAAHPESGRRYGRYSEMQNNPPRCHDRDHKHDGRFHQFGETRADMGDNPQRADGAKHEPNSEDKSEIE